MRAADIDPDRELFSIACRRQPGVLRPGCPDPAACVWAAVPVDDRLAPVYGGWMLRQCAPADEIPVLILDPVPARPVLFEMFLWFETAAVVLNDMEKARAVVLAGELCSEPEQVRRCLRMLGIPDTDFMRKRYAALLELDEAWLALIADGRVTAAAAFMLEAFPSDDRSLLAAMFSRAHFTARMQITALEGLRDLIRLEGRPLTALWSGLDLEPLLAAAAQTPRERGTAVCRRIDERLRPIFTADRSRFAAAEAALGFGTAISVEAPRAFEEPGIRFAFNARNAEEFRAAAARLAAVGPPINTLFNAVEEETDCDHNR